MSRDIPGFYYDSEKKKYFKIQKNHVAPPDSQYSEAAVARKRVSEQIHAEKVSLRLRGGQELFHRARLHEQPLHNFDRRLGVRGTGRGTRLAMAKYYCAALEYRDPPNVAKLREKWNDRDAVYHALVDNIDDRIHPFGENIIGIAASPNNLEWALLTPKGVILHSQSRYRDIIRFTRYDHGCVAFKDNNVVMCGDHTGRVRFYDIRADASVMRVRHTSQVANLVSTNTDQILVNGLSTMDIYDLRFVSQPRILKLTRKEGNKVDNRMTHDYTASYLSIVVPPEMRSEDDGLLGEKIYYVGFDYDPELGIVARGGWNKNRKSFMSLFSIDSGRCIENSRLAGERIEASPVPYIKFERLEEGGPKSVVTRVKDEMAPHGDVWEEWYPIQGADTYPGWW